MIERLKPVMSDGRLSTYLHASGHDESYALELYIWNARVGESFHLPIQAVEIALRNRINTALIEAFGENWWEDKKFVEISDKYQIHAIEQVKKRLNKRNVPLITGQIVAGLSFGFWVSILDARYNPSLWSSKFTDSFPHIPKGKKLRDLKLLASQVSDLRNRIWHHEPIFKINITNQYSLCVQALKWLCPDKHGWIKPKCSTMKVMREKPKKTP